MAAELSMAALGDGSGEGAPRARRRARSSNHSPIGAHSWVTMKSTASSQSSRQSERAARTDCPTPSSNSWAAASRFSCPAVSSSSQRLKRAFRGGPLKVRSISGAGEHGVLGTAHLPASLPHVGRGALTARCALPPGRWRGRETRSMHSAAAAHAGTPQIREAHRAHPTWAAAQQPPPSPPSPPPAPPTPSPPLLPQPPPSQGSQARCCPLRTLQAALRSTQAARARERGARARAVAGGSRVDEEGCDWRADREEIVDLEIERWSAYRRRAVAAAGAVAAAKEVIHNHGTERVADDRHAAAEARVLAHEVSVPPVELRGHFVKDELPVVRLHVVEHVHQVLAGEVAHVRGAARRHRRERAEELVEPARAQPRVPLDRTHLDVHGQLGEVVVQQPTQRAPELEVAAQPQPRATVPLGALLLVEVVVPADAVHDEHQLRHA
eukprot:CAMPEP_0180106440 /NCGR_PEP_ID=MMETSP0985-20121206/32689_1 /TAXON_ID=483367 /ORGANISM="non described non described, Strain CCMP 2436" /LENGTH=438 /DNA_ID=CAMNT_0022043755 /DNA_START=66 /DNA_END=1380 /DNA_ORIENTATION=-